MPQSGASSKSLATGAPRAEVGPVRSPMTRWTEARAQRRAAAKRSVQDRRAGPVPCGDRVIFDVWDPPTSCAPACLAFPILGDRRRALGRRHGASAAWSIRLLGSNAMYPAPSCKPQSTMLPSAPARPCLRRPPHSRRIDAAICGASAGWSWARARVAPARAGRPGACDREVMSATAKRARTSDASAKPECESVVVARRSGEGAAASASRRRVQRRAPGEGPRRHGPE
jgi:hypothetical protein